MAIFFFSRKREIVFPIGRYLQVDVHSHILPGVDDGAKDTAVAIRLLRGMHQLGFHTVIGTPHVMVDIHRNNRATITAAYGRLEKALAGTSAPMPRIYYAAEHMLDEGFFGLLEAQETIPYHTSPYMLVETPYLFRPLNLEHLSFQLGTTGYKPILAHPERYHYLFGQPEAYEKLKELGFAFQLNALSLTGYYGKQEKTAALWLLEHGFVDYLATDIHHERHLKHLVNFRIPQNTVALLESTTFHNTELAAAYHPPKPAVPA